MKNKIDRSSWLQLSDSLLHKARVFELRARRMRTQDGTHEDDYFYIKSFDWSNIIPLTDDRQVVLISQFRQGIQDVSIEIPGGLFNEGEIDGVAAAARELEEETGYRAREIKTLGPIHPNPAIQDNRAHLFLATGVTPTGKLGLDEGERINTHLAPLDHIPKMILEGEITHSIVICAFFQFAMLYGKEYGCDHWFS